MKCLHKTHIKTISSELSIYFNILSLWNNFFLIHQFYEIIIFYLNLSQIPLSFEWLNLWNELEAWVFFVFPKKTIVLTLHWTLLTFLGSCILVQSSIRIDIFSNTELNLWMDLLVNHHQIIDRNYKFTTNRDILLANCILHPTSLHDMILEPIEFENNEMDLILPPTKPSPPSPKISFSSNFANVPNNIIT